MPSTKKGSAGKGSARGTTDFDGKSGTLPITFIKSPPEIAIWHHVSLSPLGLSQESDCNETTSASSSIAFALRSAGAAVFSHLHEFSVLE